MYFYETHLHTSEGSACAVSGGSEQAEHFKALGYDGIFVTDHFFNGNSAVNRICPDAPWEEKVEAFCKGYENAKKKGDEIGLKVFFGFEFNYNGSEWLVYGLGKEWLKAHHEIMSMKPAEFLNFFRSEGGTVIQAHPFREADYINTVRILPKFIDGMESFNIKNSPDRANILADMYAQLHKIPKSCGSDCHSCNDDKLCAMGCEEEISGTEDYIKKLKNGKFRFFISREGNFYEA